MLTGDTVHPDPTKAETRTTQRSNAIAPKVKGLPSRRTTTGYGDIA